MAEETPKDFVLNLLKFTLIAFLPYVASPAIVSANTAEPQSHFFTAPETLSRGVLNPLSQSAEVLSKKDYCDIAINNWGWSDCEGIDKFIIAPIPEVAVLVIDAPNSEGYVKFDDWDSEDRQTEINNISDSLRESLKEQGKRVGEPVEFVGWRSYPELLKDKRILFYATDSSWSGEVSTNIKASVFDRRGYIVFRFVPMKDDISGDEIQDLVLQITQSYVPEAEHKYAAFSSGDKVAAVGAMGVLAGLVGVKYGKAATAGILGVLLVILKKFGALLLLPIAFVFKFFGSIFGRSKNTTSDGTVGRNGTQSPEDKSDDDNRQA